MEHLPCEGSLIGDPELLYGAASGDAQAFEAFVVRHREAVWRFARSLTRDPASAEDALQDTFLSAWKDAAGFKGEQSAVGWLFSIARHAVYRQHRGRAGEPEQMESLADLGEAAGWGAQVDPLDDLVVQDEVGRAMARLSLEDREVLLLREIEGFSIDECTDLLGIGRPALKSRLHRARLRFMAHLRGDRYEP
jgi:RNA polymerase sigma-70 factor (ECF subfamily)